MQLSKQGCTCSTARTAANRSAAVVTRASQQQQQSVAGTVAVSLAAVATAVQLTLPAAAPAVVSSSISQPAAAAAVRYQPVVSDLSVAAAPAVEVEAEDVLGNLTEDVALPPELMRFMELITNVCLPSHLCVHTLDVSRLYRIAQHNPSLN